ncbi:hypothetical protein [Ferrimicrobium sp.]|uniref:hypothetical protein n=1 Tax=Ferrimicrobium sp. TaxID=2926050 RepID=UPI00260CF9DB|nr:hypothetical protein [Ferrimicrobium sp.]
MKTQPSEGQSGEVRRRSLSRRSYWLGAIVSASALVLSGLVHVHLWLTGYRHVPTIGPLFVVQGVLALVLAIMVLVRPRRWVYLSASLFLGGTIAALFASVEVGLFGFRDALSAPYAVESLVIEAVGTLVLAFMGWLLAPAERRG